jgi:hypothetical protein
MGMSLMSDAELRLTCDCGAEQAVPSTETRVSCDCGSVYAVTVTRLTQLHQ